jgi:hypothetical protein
MTWMLVRQQPITSSLTFRDFQRDWRLSKRNANSDANEPDFIVTISASERFPWQFNTQGASKRAPSCELEVQRGQMEFPMISMARTSLMALLIVIGAYCTKSHAADASIVGS